MAKKKNYFTIEADGLTFRWLAVNRPKQLEVDVFDGAGDIIVQAAYPSIAGIGYNDFQPEIRAIAADCVKNPRNAGLCVNG